MINLKYKIMLRTYRSLPTAPVTRSSFFKNVKNINRYHRAINELISDNLIKLEVGSDKLSVTSHGVNALEAAIERREDLHRISIQFWISTIISIAALAISVIVLLSELGLLKI